MIPMFPFSINNALKLFTIEPFDEDAIKERISQAVVQSLPNKRNIKFNAIVVLECDNEPRRTLVINETISAGGGVPNGGTHNMQLSFPSSSNISSETTPTSNVLLSQQPLFPATVEGLQALLNLNRQDNVLHNNVSFIPLSSEPRATEIKTEKHLVGMDGGMCPPSRKRKSEKPCKIPQEPDSQGLDLTLGGRFQEKSVPTSTVAIWPCPPNHLGSLQRPKKPAQLPGHKKTSKVFNCNQCKLQFSSLNALCKHTFSDHRAFRCTFCSANFTQRSNLQRHSLKHVGFKPFICNVCGKAYYRKDHLVRHIEVSHPGSDPKSNITVKLSSSECLEYLERMQQNNQAILEGAADAQDPFPPVLLELTDESPLLTRPSTVKSSPGSGDLAPLGQDDSPITLPPYDYTQETSSPTDESEEPSADPIMATTFDENLVVVKEERHSPEPQAKISLEGPPCRTLVDDPPKHYPLIQPKRPAVLQGYHSNSSYPPAPGCQPLQGTPIDPSTSSLQGYPYNVLSQVTLSGRSHE